MIITPNDSISDAANALNPGETLRLRGGAYSEQVRITASGQQGAPITIAPYEAEPVTWRSYDDPLNVAGSYVRVRGIEFDRDHRRGLLRLRGHHNTLRECHIHHGQWYSLVRVDGTDCLLESNHIHHNTYGSGRDAHGVLTLGTAHRLKLLTNTIHDVTGDCFQSEDAKGAALDLRIIRNHFYTTLGWRSENAVDIKAGTGIMDGNDAHGFRDCPGEEGGEGPSASGSSGAAFFVHDHAYDWVLAHNALHDNTMGIRILNAATHHILCHNNTITNIAFDDPNAWLATGIQVSGAQHVSITKNTFDVERALAIVAHAGVAVSDNTFDGTPPQPDPVSDWKPEVLAQIDALRVWVSNWQPPLELS